MPWRSLRAVPWPSLEPGGVHCLHPPPGSDSTEYGIMRSFASTADRDAFYQTPLYQEWLARIEPMVEGEATYRNWMVSKRGFAIPMVPCHHVGKWPCLRGSRYGRSACSFRRFSRLCSAQISRRSSPPDSLLPASSSSSPGSPCPCWSKSRTLGFTDERRRKVNRVYISNEARPQTRRDVLSEREGCVKSTPEAPPR